MFSKLRLDRKSRNVTLVPFPSSSWLSNFQGLVRVKKSKPLSQPGMLKAATDQ
jgi:hypothetical protein